MTTPPWPIRESALQEILAGVAGAGHLCSESGTCFRTIRPCRLPPAHQGMKMRLGRWKCLGVMGATPPLWIPAFAGMTKRGPRNTIFVPMTNSVRGAIYFPANRSCRQAPAHEGMKNRRCDLVWRVGAVDSATPLVDPCGGQAPALQDSGICRNDEARRGNRDSRARWDASIPDRSPGHAFVPMPRMIHSLLIETVGESVWAKLLGTTSHGSCFAWARIETLQYRRLEAGRRG